MKSILLRLIIRSSKPKYLVGLIVMQILFSVFMFFAVQNIKETSKVSILDTKFSYNIEQVSELFTSYGEEGLITYNKLQLVDMFYPMVYSMLLSSILFLLFSHSRTVAVILLPIIAAYFDYVENILLFISTRTFPDLNYAMIKISSFATSLKWSLIYISVVFILIGLLRKKK